MRNVEKLYIVYRRRIDYSKSGGGSVLHGPCSLNLKVTASAASSIFVRTLHVKPDSLRMIHAGFGPCRTLLSLLTRRVTKSMATAQGRDDHEHSWNDREDLEERLVRLGKTLDWKLRETGL